MIRVLLCSSSTLTRSFVRPYLATSFSSTSYHVRFLSGRPDQHGHLTPQQRAEFERRIEEQVRRREEDKHKQRKILLGVGIFTAFFGANVICLWRRRAQFLEAEKKLPAISFNQFRKEYLVTGKVKALVIQPSFDVVDVFLRTEESDHFEKRAMKFLSTFSTGPERFATDPDVRVKYTCSAAELQKRIAEGQQEIEGESEIKLEINRFPAPREVGFIVLSAMVSVVCIGLLKL